MLMSKVTKMEIVVETKMGLSSNANTGKACANKIAPPFSYGTNEISPPKTQLGRKLMTI